jgi:hypothetical protein
MSKFKIYRSDFSDAKRAGKRNRWMYALCVLLIYIFSQLLNYSRLVDNQKTRMAIFIPLAIVIICIVVFLIVRLRVMSGSLKYIGILEITKTNLKKHIGDMTTIYNYNDICKMELEYYFKDLSISKPNSFTRSLRLIKTNHIEEVFIISCKSIDFKQKINITDSLKVLKKLTDIEVQIKDN